MGGTFAAVRAEALFVSCMQASERPGPDAVRWMIATTLRRLGVRGCAAAVAEEYGEHPETAAGRMAWALATVDAAYARPSTSIQTL